MPAGEVVESSQAVAGSSETPDDVATLYSWANLRGARYRDFSAARAQVREQARRRVQEAMESEHRRTEEAAAQAGGAPVPVSQPEVISPGSETPAQADSAKATIKGVLPVTAEPAAGLPASSATVSAAASVVFPVAVPLASSGSVAVVPAHSSAAGRGWREIPFPAARAVAAESDAAAEAAPLLQPAGSRWFALSSFFPGASYAEPARVRARIPAVAVFSLAGGVGKTSMAAALGRALAGRGERVLLVDTAPFGVLPFFFGATDQRPGTLRSFTAAGTDARMDVLTLDMDRFGQEGNVPEPLTQEILRHAGSAHRILIDLGTASGGAVRRILRMTPTVLVPLAPDMCSVASLGAIESFFRRNAAATGQAVSPYFVLNQFDETQRLHRDVLELLRGRLGERLLPFVVRRAAAVSEALAEGMTVIDYAPDSPAAADYLRLAEWLRAAAAAAMQGYDGGRWSER